MVDEPAFDVFLAHNSRDKEFVKKIAQKLKEQGLETWLDEEQIPPGSSFQQEIQQAIPRVKAAAVFIGKEDLGGWQEWELEGIIQECVDRKIPIIPVLLPGVREIPSRLRFLRLRRQVKFNSPDEAEALSILRWGITGYKPDDLPAKAIVAQILLWTKRNFAFVLPISVSTSFFLMVIRFCGGLQWLELPAYDALLRSRLLNERKDQYISIVGITDKDLGQAEKISDKKLLALLQSVEKAQPRAIGLDIYRDQPTEDSKPGQKSYQTLIDLLKKSNLIVPTCFASGKSKDGAIAYGSIPPEGLNPERFGFTDTPRDGANDNVIRRQILTQTYADSPPRCNTEFSLSLELALRYLRGKGYEPVVNADGQMQNAGGAIEIKKKGGDRGIALRELGINQRPFGYQPDFWSGYQMLINYRAAGVEPNFNIISLAQALKGEVDKDHIVLIGYTSESTNINKDLYSTPYSTINTPQTPGVIIQAHMLSQLLHAVLDNPPRPIIGVWTIWTEFLWVTAWAVIGAAIAWLSRSLRWTFVREFLAISVLIVSCYILLIMGWWVPLVPPILAITIVATITITYTESQN